MFDWLKRGKQDVAANTKPPKTKAAPDRSAQQPPLSVSALPRPPKVRVPEAALQRGRDVLLGAVADTLNEIPLPSKTSRRAYEASLEVDVGFGELRDLLEQDASLAVTLLQQANSVRYAGAKQVESVGDALSRVGLGGLRDMLMVSSSQRVLRVPGFPEKTERLQARGPAVGYCSRQVAECIGTDPDAAFTAGLLHDIGWPAAYETARRIARDLPVAIQEDGAEGLAQLAEFSHQSVGQRLAHVWNLGPRTVSAIGNHHDPLHSPVQGRETAWVVAAAMALVDSVGWYPETRVPDVLAHPLIQQVGLTPSHVARLTRTLRRDLELNAAAEVA
jgi:putative nucleotidyltransferase with HDIG domain